MARNPYYIYDLPFQPRRELCSILDADRRWEELGGEQMGIRVTDLMLIGQSIYRDKSPSWELLNKWGERNGTIKKLFVMLAAMDYQRGLVILSPYVDEKYRTLIRDGATTTMSFSPKQFCKSDLPKPVFSSTFMSSSTQGSFRTEKTMHSPNRETGSHLPRDSKFGANNLNLNDSVRALSVQSKLNGLNTQPQPATSSTKKSAEARNLKGNAANCVAESVTDNCASEKMKNVPKRAISKDKNEKASPKINGNSTPALDNLPDIMKVSYEDLRKATDDFNKARILGRGGFGAVYKGKWKGTSVAVKRLMPREGKSTASHHHVSIKQSLNELNILTRCRFDHILPLYGISLDGPEPCLVYQFMANGSLEDRLLCRGNTPPLTWSYRSNIAECTCKGLNYLHTYPGIQLIHGDVKSANILLDVNMEAKIGDFGLTREGPGCEDTHVKVSKLHGTQYYLPPEYLRQRHLSPQVDVFSYGIVLLEMATGLRPYDVHREDAKLLVDYVSDCHASGRLDSLRDTKAGEENMMWFGELVKIGQECSNNDKKKRPSMEHVFECFEKIKNEVLMVDKIRRLSNDKGSANDITKLKQLKPLELQIFYDAYKEKHGVALPSNGTSPNSPPKFVNDAILRVSGLEDVRGPPSDTIHLSEIRGPPTVDDVNYPCLAGHLANNNLCDSNSCVATIGTKQIPVNEPVLQQESLQQQPSDGRAPLPNLTVLQLQVSDIDENSNGSQSFKADYENSNTYDDYSCSSSYSDYSHDLAN